ncbi:UNVERIFIED_CONTAM: kynurenine formamidase [Acetivibrio alkalicellulosi]
MRIVDLTHTVDNSTPVYPGDKKVNVYYDKYLKINNYNTSIIEMSTHTGTHIDTPSHLFDTNTLISDINLDQLCAKGILLDVRNKDIISFRPEYEKTIQSNCIVLLYTGFDKKFNKEAYFKNHPVVDKKLAEFFVFKKIKILGIDLPSPDNYPFDIHKMLLKNNVLILENMANLDRLIGVKDFEVIVLPLKIKAEAAPVRVIARL